MPLPGPSVSIEPRINRSGQRRYEVRLRGPDGREQSRTFRTKKEAEHFQATQRADLARGSWIDPRGGDRTFAVWAEEWLASDPAKSPGAWVRDSSILRTHLLGPLGSRRLASIGRQDVQALVTRWSRQSRPRTVRRQYDTLRAILNAAVAADLLVRSPCRGIRLPEWHQEPRPVLDAAQLADLASAVGPDHALSIYLGGVLGLRWGEMAGLRVRAVDTAGRTVTVAEQRTRGKGGVMVTRQPKTAAGRRSMTVPTWLMDMIDDHIRRRGIEGVEGALLLVTSEGDGLDYSHWRQRVWLPATRAAGLVGLQFHDLRRTAATALVQEHVDVKTAQVRLGHADPRTTLGLYAQATTQADVSAAEQLETRFRPPTPPVPDPSARPESQPAQTAATQDVPSSRGINAGRAPRRSPWSRRQRSVTRDDAGREGGIRTRGLSVPNAAR